MPYKGEYFTKVPNRYVRGDIVRKFGISRKFYIMYILIDRYRTLENYSWLPINKIFEYYGYRTARGKEVLFGEVADILRHMIRNRMIELLGETDLNSLSRRDVIELKVNPSQFEPKSNYTVITAEQIKIISSAEISLKRKDLLLVFLYMVSHMNQGDGKISAFWKSIENMSRDLGMSKTTIRTCIEFLAKTLFVKREVSNTGSNNRTLPNIYVLNKVGYEKQIELALRKIQKEF